MVAGAGQRRLARYCFPCSRLEGTAKTSLPAELRPWRRAIQADLVGQLASLRAPLHHHLSACKSRSRSARGQASPHACTLSVIVARDSCIPCFHIEE